MKASHENFLSSPSKSFTLSFRFLLLTLILLAISLSLLLLRMVFFHFSLCRCSSCKLLQNNFHRHTQSTINLTVAWSRANSPLLSRCLHFIMKFTFVSFFSRVRERNKKMINVFACATWTCLWQTVPLIHSLCVCTRFSVYSDVFLYPMIVLLSQNAFDSVQSWTVHQQGASNWVECQWEKKKKMPTVEKVHSFNDNTFVRCPLCCFCVSLAHCPSPSLVFFLFLSLSQLIFSSRFNFSRVLHSSMATDRLHVHKCDVLSSFTSWPRSMCILLRGVCDERWIACVRQSLV